MQENWLLCWNLSKEKLQKQKQATNKKGTSSLLNINITRGEEESNTARIILSLLLTRTQKGTDPGTSCMWNGNQNMKNMTTVIG